MDLETYRTYCLNKKGVTESFPFDQKTLVFKGGNKMFALTEVEEYSSINLKCDPERAIVLRETYEGIRPGWHMNKRHWNTVSVNADVDDSLVYELIDLSYDLIVASLPKKIRDGL